MILYDHPLSGNCYKVRLMLAHLGLPYERVELSVDGNRSDRPREFWDKTPFGRIPVLELGDGRSLAESNAILTYLAEGTPYLPGDPFERARVLAWMFFEQNNHEPYIATARYWISIRREPNERRAVLPLWKAAGDEALQLMERHLAQHAFFGGDGYTVADIALYAYTHVADEGEFDLRPHSAIRAWLERVRAQPGHVPLLG